MSKYGDVAIEKALILWETDSAGQPPVLVVPIDKPGTSKREEGYNKSGGAAFSHWEGDKPSLALRLLLNFHSMVVRDGIDPKEVHKAFLVIPEYRQIISPDIEGAEEQSEVFSSAMTRILK